MKNIMIPKNRAVGMMILNIFLCRNYVGKMPYLINSFKN
jgi:hypothetical protein